MMDETMTDEARESLTNVSLPGGLRLSMVEETGCLWVYCLPADGAEPDEIETAGAGSVWGLELQHDDAGLSRVTIRSGCMGGSERGLRVRSPRTVGNQREGRQ